MNKISIKAICAIGMFAAVISVLSILTIPTPWGVPFTLQTFAVAIAGYVLGRKYGTIATILYVLLGLVGVPVYAGMSAGPGVLFGTSGGYIFGFIIMTFFCGLGIELGNKKNKIVFSVLFGLIGLLSCHILGIIQLKLVLKCTWIEAALWGSVPYLVKDILSVIGAYLVAVVIKKTLEKANVMQIA